MLPLAKLRRIAVRDLPVYALAGGPLAVRASHFLVYSQISSSLIRRRAGARSSKPLDRKLKFRVQTLGWSWTIH
jgi:hypothetical protein